MKGKLRYQVDGRTVERDVNYIPVRFILALLLAVLETVAVITVLILFGKYIPYFYLAMWATEIGCVIHIIAYIDGEAALTVRIYGASGKPIMLFAENNTVTFTSLRQYTK